MTAHSIRFRRVGRGRRARIEFEVFSRMDRQIVRERPSAIGCCNHAWQRRGATVFVLTPVTVTEDPRYSVSPGSGPTS